MSFNKIGLLFKFFAIKLKMDLISFCNNETELFEFMILVFFYFFFIIGITSFFCSIPSPLGVNLGTPEQSEIVSLYVTRKIRKSLSFPGISRAVMGYPLTPAEKEVVEKSRTLL